MKVHIALLGSYYFTFMALHCGIYSPHKVCHKSNECTAVMKYNSSLLCAFYTLSIHAQRVLIGFQ